MIETLIGRALALRPVMNLTISKLIHRRYSLKLQIRPVKLVHSALNTDNHITT